MNCYEIVTQKIIERLTAAIENGDVFHWIKPWNGGVEVAYRYVDQKPYRGINQILLDPGEYVTYKQLCELQKKHPEYKIKKGAKKYPVFFYGFNERENDVENGEKETKRVPYFKYYSVFNVADIENMPLRFPCKTITHNINENVENAIKVLEEYEKRIGLEVNTQIGSRRAYYRPSTHSITLPDISQFESMYEYISTRAHEDVHASSKILDRKLGSSFGSEMYSKEELIAEMGAAMFCARMHISDDQTENNSIAYLQHWLNHIDKENIYFVAQAANSAQKAMDLIFDEVFVNKNEIEPVEENLVEQISA